MEIGPDPEALFWRDTCALVQQRTEMFPGAGNPFQIGVRSQIIKKLPEQT